MNYPNCLSQNVEIEEIHLVVPRGPDRRSSQSTGNGPWITEEGLVLADRRSGKDRRKASADLDVELQCDSIGIGEE